MDHGPMPPQGQVHITPPAPHHATPPRGHLLKCMEPCAPMGSRGLLRLLARSKEFFPFPSQRLHQKPQKVSQARQHIVWNGSTA